MAKGETQNIGLVKEIQRVPMVKVLLYDPGFLRVLVQENLQQVMAAEFEGYLQAQPYERTEVRQGYRNGSYTRRLKTRVGPMSCVTVKAALVRNCSGAVSATNKPSYCH